MIFSGIGPELLYLIVALLIALTVHEASHALVAWLLGDPTPKNMGRLSLNPFAHLDPLGVIMILTVGLGWGKPVQINPDKLKPNPQVGMALVAAAGPVSNILLGALLSIPIRLRLISLLPYRLFDVSFLPPELQMFAFGKIVFYTVWLCFALAVFNLIPINPLDGSRIWEILLPKRLYFRIAQVEMLGLALVIGLILSDRFFGTNILGRLLGPPVAWVWWQFVGMSPPFPM